MIIMSPLPIPENYLLPAAAGIAILVIIVLIVLFRLRNRPGPSRPAAYGPVPVRKFAYQPESRPVLHIPLVRKSVPVRNEPQPPTVSRIDLVSGTRDLAGSLAALVKKYSLVSVTLASRDGLAIASTDPAGAGVDAAKYAEIFASSPLFETPGAVIFGLSHKGTDLIGIIRANREISEEMCQNIESDTKVILNSWI